MKFRTYIKMVLSLILDWLGFEIVEKQNPEKKKNRDEKNDNVKFRRPHKNNFNQKKKKEFHKGQKGSFKYNKTNDRTRKSNLQNVPSSEQ